MRAIGRAIRWAFDAYTDFTDNGGFIAIGVLWLVVWFFMNHVKP